jgi:hypothetical protein
VYEEMRQLILPLYQPVWTYEIGIAVTAILLFAVGISSSNWLIAILGLGLG